MIRKTGTKTELRSRFWIGDVHKAENETNLLTARFVNSFANTYFFRKLRMNESLARGLWKHCLQEMTCLKGFLPHFYKTMRKNHEQDRNLEIILSTNRV
jgi:DAPG hydrolase PhiG domain